MISNVQFRRLSAAYGAAGFSFMASFLRDYILVTQSNQSALFFQFLYIASMAAGFGVNAITLGRGRVRPMAMAILTLVGIIIIVVALPSPLKTTQTVLLLSSIIVLWIIGAHWSRVIIEKGNLFLGKCREGVTSICFAIFILLGAGIEWSFISSVAIGTFFAWLIIKSLKAAPITSPKLGHTLEFQRLLQSVVLSNVATFAISTWALIQTQKIEDIYGVSIPVAIRFSMYAYQTLTIGSVILLVRGARIPQKNIQLFTIVAILFFLASLLAPLSIGLFSIPIAAGIIHYCAVIFLQRHT